MSAADFLDRMQPGGPPVYAVHSYTFGVARGGSGRHRWHIPSYAQRVLHCAVHAGHVDALHHRGCHIRCSVSCARSQVGDTARRTYSRVRIGFRLGPVMPAASRVMSGYSCACVRLGFLRYPSISLRSISYTNIRSGRIDAPSSANDCSAARLIPLCS